MISMLYLIYIYIYIYIYKYIYCIEINLQIYILLYSSYSSNLSSYFNGIFHFKHRKNIEQKKSKFLRI